MPNSQLEKKKNVYLAAVQCSGSSVDVEADFPDTDGQSAVLNRKVQGLKKIIVCLRMLYKLPGFSSCAGEGLLESRGGREERLETSSLCTKFPPGPT